MRAPAPDSAVPGVPFNSEDPHYRYFWTAQYDDLVTGPWLAQLDDEGRARPPSALDMTRVVRLRFLPQRPGLQPVEVRAQKALGETIRHCWTVDRPVDMTMPSTIAFVIVLARRVGGELVETYCHLLEDGSIYLGSRANW